MFSILPRREFISAKTSPKYSSAVITSNLIIGSNKAGEAFANASLVAIDAAILKAISDESTS